MFKELLINENEKAIKAYINETHSFDLAQDFISLDKEQQMKLYPYISHEIMADICAYLDPEDAARIINDFDLLQQKKIIDYMDPDDATDMIQALDTDQIEALIETLEDREEISELLSYEDDETGSMMTQSIVRLNPSIDIKKATKIVIAEAPDVETIQTLFVVSDDETFLGIIKLKNLLKAKPPTTINDIMETSVWVYDQDSMMSTIQQMNQYNTFHMPVCDQDQKLLGVVTLDDALDVYQEEAQEDFEKLAALPETIHDKPYKIALHRFPWLLILLFVSIPVSLITQMFDAVITAVAIIVIFQPMISGAAGNVATQTLAVTLRNFANEEEQMLKNSFKEILSGLFIAIAMAAAAFLITYIFTSIQQHLNIEPLLMASIVAIALMTTVFLAPIIAISVPTILRLLKLDPAVASGPMITTLLDMTTVCVYFGLSTLLLGVML